MRALGAALVDIGRALLSYVIPITFETRTVRDSVPSDAIVAERQPCDVCDKPSTHTTTPGGFRFCDEHSMGTRAPASTTGSEQ